MSEFNSKLPAENLGFSAGNLLIDFHSHILPHVDHGSRRTQTGLDQLALIYSSGVGTVCSTSHFYPQDILVKDFLNMRNDSFKRLLEKNGDSPRPQIILGAEVLICEGLANMEGLEGLCFEGTDVMLLEMPFTKESWSSGLYDTVLEIAERGIRPVFAHVDRYPRELVEPLFKMGFSAQINANSMHGLFRKKYLDKWIEEGKIVAFGSDLHGSSPESYEAFVKLLEKRGDMVTEIMKKTNELLRDAKRF